MKLNRIPALAALAVAAMLIVGQFVGAQAASPEPAAHYEASGISAHDSPPPQASSMGRAMVVQPADQSPLDFTVQGRLTNHNGNPITTATNVVFNLYSVASGGTAELTQSASITPNANGLFTYVFVVDTSSNFNNVQLFDSKQYLGITVGSDAEMTPRLELTASPYSMSLAPGAEVIGNADYGLNTNHGLLNLYNTNSTNLNSAGLYASGNTGVWGVARSNAGGSSWGGYFDNIINDAGSSQYGVGVYAANGWGVYSVSGGGSSRQDSIGVVGQSTAANGAGGVFTGTSAVVGYSSSSGNSAGYGGQFFNAGGGSGLQFGLSAYSSSSGGTDGYGGSFYNAGGGSGTQFGVSADTSTSGAATGIGGNFDNFGGGSGFQAGVNATSPGYGLYAGSTASTASQQSAGVVGQSTATNGIGGVFTGTTGVVVSGTNGTAFRATASSSGSVNGFGGSFTNNGGGSGTQFGIYSYAPTTGGSLGYSGYFTSNSDTATALYVRGAIVSTGGGLAPNYSTQVQYHGSAPLRPGDVVAADGNNTMVDGTPTLGVVKANAANAKAAIGVVQYRFKAIGKEEKSGRTDWQVDETSTSFQSGDLLSAVVLGQVQMEVGQAGIGDRVALAPDGSPTLAGDDNKYPIGKVVSAPDKNGYVTVFVNLKLGTRDEA